MNCPDFDELSAYADQETTPAGRIAITSHVHRCAQCTQQLERICALRSGLHALPSPQLGLDLAARYSQRQEIAQRPKTRRFGRPQWGPAGAALAALAAGAWLEMGLLGGAVVHAPEAYLVRAFDPVPPGGLCAVRELCSPMKDLP